MRSAGTRGGADQCTPSISLSHTRTHTHTHVLHYLHFSGDELLLTEMIFNGAFNDLSVEQCVALMSCFVFEEKVRVVIMCLWPGGVGGKGAIVITVCT